MDELIRRVEALRTLTPRELEILQLTCAKQLQRDIAQRLFISLRTVKFHHGNIYEKLGLADLQQAPRQRELGRYCQALDAMDAGQLPMPGAAPPEPAPDPPQPSMRALAAVEEDSKALAKFYLEEEERRRLPAVREGAEPRPWHAPIPAPPVVRPPGRMWFPLAFTAALAVLLAAGLVVALARPRQTTTVVREVVTVTPAAVTATPSPSATATASPTPVPTPTPRPTPTPQALGEPSYAVNTQQVGCHAEPSADAPVVVQLPPGTVQALDQVIRLPEGTWHREAERQCWIRTQPGPVELFADGARAQAAAGRFAPPGTVLYQADWTAGMSGWPSASGWAAFRGLLINDGSGGSRDEWVRAPYAPGTNEIDDYAVEADIQIVKLNCGSFGLVARGAFTGGIVLDNNDGYCSNRGNGSAKLSLFGCCAELASRGATSNTTWHTYRLEVRGNEETFLVDGSPFVRATDNRFLTGGEVGLWSQNVQVNVRSFKVIKL